MNRNSILSFIVVATGIGALLATTATSQLGTPKSYVNLQPTTPGTSQSGHINVTGSVLARRIGVGVIPDPEFDLQVRGQGKVHIASETDSASLALLGTDGPGTFIPVYFWMGTGTNSAWFHVTGLGTSSPGDLAFNVGSGERMRIMNANGNVGIGTASPDVKLHVADGSFFVTGSAVSTGRASFMNFSQPNGVLIRGENVNSPLHSASLTLATGIHSSGIAISGSGRGPVGDMLFSAGSAGSPPVERMRLTSGNGFLGIGTTSPTDLLHVAGRIRSQKIYLSDPLPGESSIYVNNSASSGQNSDGAYINTASTSGKGVYGRAFALSGQTYGGLFESLSPSGTGVYAYNPSSTGQTAGGQFEVSSINGEAIFSRANATSGSSMAGRFSNESTSGYGVYASANSVTGTNYGVYGRTSSPSGFAIFGSGAIGASIKAFRIDHPFDPENKYLQHYTTESPMPQNSYSGNITTDAKGYAWVSLPEYFEEINTNVKYQLTVVDDNDTDSFVMAKVSKTIRNNQFQIRTNAPGVTVSWRIEADRNDLFIREYQPKDVVEKQGIERGHYQHPELYGLEKAHTTVAPPRPNK